MNTIVLISCGSKKAKEKTQAQNMYLGDLFKKSLEYAKTLTHEKNIYILSAKYGLLSLEDEIDYYNETLTYIPPKKKGETRVLTQQERKEWAENVLNELSKVADIQTDKFIILAGEPYIKPLRKKIKNIETPLKGKGIGERLQFFNNQINKIQ